MVDIAECSDRMISSNTAYLETSMKITKNEAGQVSKVGRIALRADITLWNMANDYLEVFSTKRKLPLSIDVKVDTEVEYQMKETLSGIYHTVILRTEEGAFSATKRTDREGNEVTGNFWLN